MVGFVYHVTSSLAGALWSTTRNLLDALDGSQEPLQKKEVDHAQNSETSSADDRGLDTKQHRRQTRQAESSRDFGASSKPLPIKPKTHAASPDHRYIGSSHVQPTLNADHFQNLRHSQSMPSLAAPSHQRPCKSTRTGSMMPTSQETFMDLAHITGNPIISRYEMHQLPSSRPTMRRVRFADTKAMQSVTGGRHLGSVTDNEWKASNKTLMKGRTVVGVK